MHDYQFLAGSMCTLIGNNLYSWLFNPKKKTARVVMLGLDGVGKTSIIYSLAEGKPLDWTFLPSIGGFLTADLFRLPSP